MSNCLLLFFEFFKIGLFTFGGGYASLPFLYHIVENYKWFTYSDLTNLIAVSGLTPGPIGLNMATYSGFNTSGIIGAVISSTALVFPMLIVAGVVFKLYKKFSDNEYVKSVLCILRPTSCALLCFVACKLLYDLIYLPKDYMGLMLAALLFLLSCKLPPNPVIYMAIAALFGIIVKLFI